MTDALRLAHLRGYYVPELDYWISRRMLDVATAGWSPEDWLRAIGDAWHIAEIH